MRDEIHTELADRLRASQLRSQERRMLLARLPTLGSSAAMGLGCVLTTCLQLAGVPLGWGIPLILGSAALGTGVASRWLHQSPLAASQFGTAITLVATLLTMPLADADLSAPIGVASLAMIAVAGTLSARPGAWHWVPAVVVAWWTIVAIHPPAPANTVPALVFPAWLLTTTGLLVARLTATLDAHETLSQDALEGMARVGRILDEERARALQASHAKSTFLTSMSHELRTPLNAIIGYSQMILEEPDDVETEDVERIEEAGRHLLDLVNDVLDMSRIEAGALEIRRSTIDLRDLLGELHAMTRGLANTRGLDLVWELDPMVPSQIPGDPLRVRQVLINLLGNAVKFTERGQVRMEARLVDGRFVAQVSDTGSGIAPELMPLVFQPFVQGSNQGTKNPGSGLGLAIAKQLARAMQGDLRVESQVGVGSTFWFELPLEPDYPSDGGSSSNPDISASIAASS